MLNKLKSAVKHCDLFGVNPDLVLAKSRTVSTVYGFAYTVATFLAIIIFMAVYFSGLETKYDLRREYVTTDIRENSFALTGTAIQPNQRTFNVAFGLSDQHNDPAPVEDDNYGSLQPYWMRRDENGVFRYEMLDWEPCT